MVKAKRKPGDPVVADHIEWHPKHPSVITAVYCPGCRTKIQGLVPHEDVESVRTVNGRTIVERRMIMAQLPAYGEITLKMDNGSKHVMAVCPGCADTATMDDIQEWYLKDIQAFIDTEKRSRSQAKPDLTLLTSRKPLKIVKE